MAADLKKFLPLTRNRLILKAVELSEAEVHWRKFQESLSERGLHGDAMITSDNHAGICE